GAKTGSGDVADRRTRVRLGPEQEIRVGDLPVIAELEAGERGRASDVAAVDRGSRRIGELRTYETAADMGPDIKARPRPQRHRGIGNRHIRGIGESRTQQQSKNRY